MSLRSHPKPPMAVTKTFTKGGQVTLHNLRMIRQVIMVTLLLTLIGGVVFCTIKTWTDYTPYQRYGLASWYWAELRMGISANKLQEWQSFRYSNGQVASVQCAVIYHHKTLKAWVRDFETRLMANVYTTLWTMAGLFMGISVFWWWRGQIKKAKQILSGSQIVTAQALQTLLKKEKIASSLMLGGVNLRHNAETQHIMICGTTGTGKSNCLSQLFPQIRLLGHRAVVVDTTGEFVARFYCPQTDILINPFDKRSVGWSPWTDCRSDYHYDELANAFIPQTGHDRFWADSARTLFAEGLKLLAVQDNRDVEALLNLLLESSIRDLFEALKYTPAAGLVDPAGDRTAVSIRAHLTPYLKSLRYLCTGKPAFSVRDWIQAVDQDAVPAQPTDSTNKELTGQDPTSGFQEQTGQGSDQAKSSQAQPQGGQTQKSPWLFIVSTPDQRDTLRPLITGLMSSAINSLMSREPSQERRVWFIIDELISLNKQEAIPKALAEIRKYGGCVVAGLQNIPQLQDRYGIAETKSLTSLFNTKIIFRNGDPETARHMSRMLGEQEVREAVENISYGAHQMRDGVSLNEQQRVKPVVSAHDIMSLDDLQAFIKLPGDLPVARLQFTIDQTPRNHLSFIATIPVEIRDGESLDCPDNGNENIPREEGATRQTVS